MGLLDSVIGGVLGQALGGRGGAMSPLVKALLTLLLAKGASGGIGGALGDILGGDRQRPPGPDAGRPDDERGHDPGAGDIGGFGHPAERRDDPSLPGGDYGDLAGMLDGPGDGAEAPRSGSSPQRPSGGLDGLIEGFRANGLGDVIASWIGRGENRAVAPHDLARALGPDTLDALQGETGMDRNALLSQLAEVLPQVVHGLTPQGRVPDEAERRAW